MLINTLREIGNMYFDVACFLQAWVFNKNQGLSVSFFDYLSNPSLCGHFPAYDEAAKILKNPGTVASLYLKKQKIKDEYAGMFVEMDSHGNYRFNKIAPYKVFWQERGVLVCFRLGIGLNHWVILDRKVKRIK